jgi:hypothetical protein
MSVFPPAPNPLKERALARRRAALETYGDWLAGAENDATVVPFARAAG